MLVVLLIMVVMIIEEVIKFYMISEMLLEFFRNVIVACRGGFSRGGCSRGGCSRVGFSRCGFSCGFGRSRGGGFCDENVLDFMIQVMMGDEFQEFSLNDEIRNACVCV